MHLLYPTILHTHLTSAVVSFSSLIIALILLYLEWKLKILGQHTELHTDSGLRKECKKKKKCNSSLPSKKDSTWINISNYIF